MMGFQETSGEGEERLKQTCLARSQCAGFPALVGRVALNTAVPHGSKRTSSRGQC